MKTIIFSFFVVLIILFNFSYSFSNNPDSCLVAYWSFDDSTAHDFSGHGYDGIIKNNPTPTMGLKGSCFYFHGKDTWIYANDNSNLIGDHILLPKINFAGIRQFTISLFVKGEQFSANSGGDAYIFYGDHDLGWLGIANIRATTYDSLSVKFSVGADVNNIVPISYPFDFNNHYNWIHYCLVFDNGIIKVYKNAKLIGSKTENVRITGSDAGIACHWWTLDPGNYRKSARYTGYMDEVKIFNIALTPCEVATIYRQFFPNERPKILGDTVICLTSPIQLSLSKNYLSYKWSTGETTKTIYVQDSGIYKVYVTDSSLCTDSASINIHTIRPKIIRTGSICQGNVVLYLDKNYSSYLWSTGDISSSISVTAAGTYNVKVVDENGCSSVAEITVKSDQNLLEFSPLFSDSSFSLDSSNYSGIICKTLKIRNTALNPIIINDILLYKNTSFSLPQSQFPIYIDSNETKSLIICYSPSKLGLERDTIKWDGYCANIFIPLKATGTIDELSGVSRCDISISVTTKKIGGTIISINKIISSNTNISLEYNITSKDLSQSNISATLYNSIGSFIAGGIIQTYSQSQKNNFYSENGTIEISVENLAAGVYICTIRTITGVMSIPILIKE